MTEEQFKFLFDSHFDSIRRYLYFRSGDTALSTDLAQDTFMRVWEKKLVFGPRKNRALLYKIASDLFVSHSRRRRVYKEIQKELKFDLNWENPEDQIHYKELQKKYENALTKISENQRIVFLMSRMDELTYREIADRLSLSIKTVEKRMSIALAIMRKEIKPDEKGSKTYAATR